MRLTADNVVEEIPSDELERMKGKALAMRQQTEQALGLQRAPQRDRQTRSAGVYVGKKRGLVLLVSFSNLDMTIANPREEFTALFNQQGYSKDGMAGSVKDYFLAQSYGQLDIDFDVVGPYKLNKPLSYYGGNSENGKDVNVHEMAKEAMLMADEDVFLDDMTLDTLSEELGVRAKRMQKDAGGQLRDILGALPETI